MEIVKVKCPENKYPIKCPDITRKDGITVHNTANDASAMAEVSYMLGNNNKVSYHVAVDDYRVVEALPFDRSCYAAGDGRYGYGNANTINIEICYSLSGGERFDKAEELAAEYIAYLLQLYGWGIDKVGTHQMRSGKYCPHRTLDYGWNRFVDKIKKYLNPPLKLEDIADLDLYYDVNKDVAQAYGRNYDKLWEHLVNCGVKEGRLYSYIFDPKWYINKHSDVKKAYGTNYQKILDHYLNYGAKEGRQAISIFDDKYYLEKNKDLQNAGFNLVQSVKHFSTYGINEWRETSKDFDVRKYKERYEDLRKAFGNTCYKYYKHYLIFGIKENRKGN